MRLVALTIALVLSACTAKVEQAPAPSPPEPEAVSPSPVEVVEPEAPVAQPPPAETAPTPPVKVEIDVVEPDPPETTIAGIADALYQHTLPCTADGIPERYDEIIRKAVKRYWSVERRAYWCWLKAVAWTESSFRASASGDDGDSLGLFQVRSSTWEEWAERIEMPQARATEAKSAARVAAAYMEHLGDKWIWARPVESTITLASASYNAGFGNVLKAQRVADMAKHWNTGIRDAMPQVTGRNATITQHYISRIRERYELMTGTALDRY